MEEVSFVDPRNRLHLLSSVHLASRFVIGQHELHLDSLSLKFRDLKLVVILSYHYLIQWIQLQLIILGLVWVKINLLQIILNFDLASWQISKACLSSPHSNADSESSAWSKRKKLNIGKD